MFPHIFYLILVLVLVSFAPIGTDLTGVASPWLAFSLSMCFYALILGLIAGQNLIFWRFIRGNKSVFLGATNLLLVSFFVVYHFLFAGHRVFPESQTIHSLSSILLYFFGLFIFYLTAYPYLAAGARGTARSGAVFTWTKLRFLIPFTLPFLFFSFLLDLAEGFSGISEEVDTLILIGVTGLFLVLMMLFFPPVIQFIWNCRPLRDKALAKRLEALCQRAGFCHAGLKSWTVLNHSYTAGIIGVLPQFRYVMFTQRLIDELPQESIEAVLAHEIGHSRRKHLFIYPWILFGMIILLGVILLLIPEDMVHYLEGQHPPLASLGIVLFYVALIGLYFRIVFGYFSRLFERQADLHIFELGIPVDHMIDALDRLGTITGNTHHHPSWHHYSIQQRIDFLEKANKNRKLIDLHHRRVRKNLLLYTCFAVTGIVILMIDSFAGIS